MEFFKLIAVIQSFLTPALLKPVYRKENEGNPMFGHCYVASEALFHLIKQFNLKRGYRPHYGKDHRGITHWWLQTSVGEILDPTAEQYLSQGVSPPYNRGRAGSFLTKQPSKRAQIVINQVLNSFNEVVPPPEGTTPDFFT